MPLAPVIALTRCYERAARQPKIRAEQWARLAEDKAFPIDAAARDLTYAPRPFTEGIREEAVVLGLASASPGRRRVLMTVTFLTALTVQFVMVVLIRHRLGRRWLRRPVTVFVLTSVVYLGIAPALLAIPSIGLEDSYRLGIQRGYVDVGDPDPVLRDAGADARIPPDPSGTNGHP